MTQVFAVTRHYEGQPEVLCVHPTRVIAEVCCAAKANVRARANRMHEAMRDSDGDFVTSGREFFRVEAHVVFNYPCGDVAEKGHETAEAPNGLSYFLDHMAGLHNEPHPECVHKECMRHG